MTEYKHWKKLNQRQKMSKKARFEYLMDKIEALENGEDEEDESDSQNNNNNNDDDVVVDVIVTGNISVTVKDDDGEGYNSVNVVLSNDDNEYTGTTGKAGGCNINNVVVGEYDVNVFISETRTFEYGKYNVIDGDNELNIIIPKTYTATTPTMEEEEGEW